VKISRNFSHKNILFNAEGGGTSTWRPEVKMVLGEEMNEDGSAKNPQQLLQRLQQVLPQLRNELPQLAEAVSAGDVDQMQALLRDKAKAQKDALQKQRELEQRIANDPFDVDAQKMLEEQIHQEQIQENMSAALEQMPEAFARVNVRASCLHQEAIMLMHDCCMIAHCMKCVLLS
jgi:hypothetical protein